jgi:hypothetical protein
VKIMGWPWRFAQPDLATLTGPTRVTVVGTIASPNALDSPLTGLRAAAFVVLFVERTTDGADDPRRVPTDVFRSLGYSMVGESLRISVASDPRLIEVPCAHTCVKLDPPWQGVVPLEHPLPRELASCAARASGRGVVYFRETPLCTGDRVRLRAVLEPAVQVAPSAYRDEPQAVLRVRPDLGLVYLEELLDVPAW